MARKRHSDEDIVSCCARSRCGIVANNPWAGQQLSKKPKTTRLAWSLSEVVALIERAPTDVLHDAITIAALSGLRAG